MIDTQKIFDFDKSLLNEDIKYIAGIDEVGRGPLAGPVVTACVVMPYDEMLNGVFDITGYIEDKFYRVYSPTEFLGIGWVDKGFLKIKSYVR